MTVARQESLLRFHLLQTRRMQRRLGIDPGPFPFPPYQSSSFALLRPQEPKENLTKRKGTVGDR